MPKYKSLGAAAKMACKQYQYTSQYHSNLRVPMIKSGATKWFVGIYDQAKVSKDIVVPSGSISAMRVSVYRQAIIYQLLHDIDNMHSSALIDAKPTFIQFSDAVTKQFNSSQMRSPSAANIEYLLSWITEPDYSRMRYLDDVLTDEDVQTDSFFDILSIAYYAEVIEVATILYDGLMKYVH